MLNNIVLQDAALFYDTYIQRIQMTQYILEASNWLNLNAVFDFFRDLKQSYETKRNIRITINELSKLSDKDLRDIGIHRGDIWSIAHQCGDNMRGWV